MPGNAASRHCERSEAIQGSTQPYDILDRRVASLLAMTPNDKGTCP
jgi:hypothetical protein